MPKGKRPSKLKLKPAGKRPKLNPAKTPRSKQAPRKTTPGQKKSRRRGGEKARDTNRTKDQTRPPNKTDTEEPRGRTDQDRSPTGSLPNTHHQPRRHTRKNSHLGKPKDLVGTWGAVLAGHVLPTVRLL